MSLSVPWDPSNQVGLKPTEGKRRLARAFRRLFVFQMYLSYNNVSALKLMDTRNNWVLTSEKNKVSSFAMRKEASRCLGFSSDLIVF